MDAYVGWREAHRRGLLDHIQAGVHAAGRVPEVEHPSVAQPPDRASARRREMCLTRDAS